MYEVVAAFICGFLVSRGSDMLKVKVTSTFAQLVAAGFVGFVLARLVFGKSVTSGFERFPPPLTSFSLPTGDTLLPYTQGRAFIPHTTYPTAPPGPAVPESNPEPYSCMWDPSLPGATPTVPTAAPTAPTPRPVNSILPSAMRSPTPSYAATNANDFDDM